VRSFIEVLGSVLEGVVFAYVSCFVNRQVVVAKAKMIQEGIGVVVLQTTFLDSKVFHSLCVSICSHIANLMQDCLGCCGVENKKVINTCRRYAPNAYFLQLS
jgi:hypothetical protein